MKFKTVELGQWNTTLLEKYKELIKQFALEIEPFDKCNTAKDLQGVVLDENVIDKAKGHNVTFFDVDNKYVGYAAWFLYHDDWKDYSEVWLGQIYVLPDYRQQGIYKEFLKQLPDICEEVCLEKPKYLKAGVLKDNTSSLEVHDKLGFEKEWVCLCKEIKK